MKDYMDKIQKEFIDKVMGEDPKIKFVKYPNPSKTNVDKEKIATEETKDTKDKQKIPNTVDPGK